MKNRIFSRLRQAFTMKKNMTLSALWENVILANVILFADGTITCVKSDTM